MPEDLEAKLIAAIPAAAPARRRNRAATWRWAAGVGLAAAAALALVVLLSHRHEPDRRRSPVVSDGRAESTPSGLLASSDPKETDPCDILPPLPEWR
ncbi:MAG: hypothetical protein GX616_27525 [Planctomycetes bacterium]|nr:hypothetical protein [Planctomycetota bacterium]